MAEVKPFRGLRPPRDIARDLSCLPYDVMNTEEARKWQKARSARFFISRDPRSTFIPTRMFIVRMCYEKSASNFKLWREKGWLVQDQEPHFYIYAQTMKGRTQYGIVGCASVDDYLNGVIRKHELTRPIRNRTG